MLTWTDYIDGEPGQNPGDPGTSQTLAHFQSEAHATVEYVTDWDNTRSWNEVLVPTLGAGRSSGWDIVVPTYWVASRMIERGWAEQIPLEAVPNHVNLDPAFLTMGWDRGARYHMPWQAGITGIACDVAAVGSGEISLDLLFDKRFKGKAGMVDQMRETLALIMLKQGADPSRPTVGAAEDALKTLEDAVSSGQVKLFGPEYKTELDEGKLDVCLAWSGDMYQLGKTRQDIKFEIPKEGGIRWFDTMVIPKGAENLAAAAKWMNFVYDPSNAARVTAGVQFNSPVVGVREALGRMGPEEVALAKDPKLFPDPETQRRLYTWGTMDSADEDRLQARFDRLVAR
jgi:spermidine/putrescine transport system substrate-binding protein